MNGTILSPDTNDLICPDSKMKISYKWKLLNIIFNRLGVDMRSNKNNCSIEPFFKLSFFSVSLKFINSLVFSIAIVSYWWKRNPFTSSAWEYFCVKIIIKRRFWNNLNGNIHCSLKDHLAKFLPFHPYRISNL